MEINERTITERSGVVEIRPGCPGGLYLMYLKTAAKEMVRILDGPLGVGVSVDVQINDLMPLIRNLIDLYNQIEVSPLTTFMVRREEN